MEEMDMSYERHNEADLWAREKEMKSKRHE
jgi:hypothetical protein